MTRQGGVSTPIFDELLREMTEGVRPPAPPPAPAPATAAATPGEPVPRRRHRAD